MQMLISNDDDDDDRCNKRSNKNSQRVCNEIFNKGFQTLDYKRS